MDSLQDIYQSIRESPNIIGLVEKSEMLINNFSESANSLDDTHKLLIGVSFVVLLLFIILFKFVFGQSKSKLKKNTYIFCGLPGCGKTRLLTSFVQKKPLDKTFTVPSMDVFEYKLNPANSKSSFVRLVDIPGMARFNSLFVNYLDTTKSLIFMIDSEKVDPLGATMDDLDDDIDLSLDMDTDSPNERMMSVATQLRSILLHPKFRDDIKIFFICSKANSLNAIGIPEIQQYLEKALSLVEKNITDSVTVGTQGANLDSTETFLAEPNTPVKFENLVWDYTFLSLNTDATNDQITQIISKVTQSSK